MTYVIDAEAGEIRNRHGRLLKGSRNRCGYVQIIDGRIGFWKMAHRMIWESVHGPIPEGLEINHKNGVKDDNRLENLELMTRGENIAHAYAMGLRQSKRGTHWKVTPEQIAELRQRRAAGENPRDLAREYGIGKTHVYNLTAVV